MKSALFVVFQILKIISIGNLRNNGLFWLISYVWNMTPELNVHLHSFP